MKHTEARTKKAPKLWLLRFRKLLKVKHISKLSLWVSSLLATAFITSAITWTVSKNLDENSQTKIYDYAYVAGESTHAPQGKVDCWVNGLNGRSDVYKCSKDNSIFTPCFRQDISDLVKCPLSPYSEQDTKYFEASFTKDTEPLASTFGKEPDPWFIYLSTGEECGFLNGATTTIANKRMDFGCKNSGISLYLPVDNNDGTYTIACLKNARLEQCKIKEMWR